MADVTFNTTAGAVVARKLLILYLNIGTSEAPSWAPVGKRVEESAMEYDWKEETKTDILGNNYTIASDPIITQTFDPCELDSGDAAQVRIWNQAIRDHDIAAMSNNDLLVVHTYAGDPETGAFAERYPNSFVKPTSLGGSNTVAMPIEATFGGIREKGTAMVSAGVVTFTAAVA